MNAWKVILSTLVIFIAGVITGGLLVTNAFRVKESRPKQINVGNNNVANPWLTRNKELLRRMDRELELTPEQHERIERIIDASQERTKFLWKPIMPQMSKEMQLAHSQIRDELTADQKKKFDGFVRQHPAQERHRLGTNALSGNVTNSSSSSNIVTNAAPASP